MTASGSNAIYDNIGIPIYPGDLLKSFHFTGARKKKYWLYHVAVQNGLWLTMVPTSHLEPSKISGGGTVLLTQKMADNAEIIDGSGPGEIIDFNDRPRKKS